MTLLVAGGLSGGELALIVMVTLVVLAVPVLVLWLVFTAGRTRGHDDRRGGPPGTG